MIRYIVKYIDGSNKVREYKTCANKMLALEAASQLGEQIKPWIDVYDMRKVSTISVYPPKYKMIDIKEFITMGIKTLAGMIESKTGYNPTEVEPGFANDVFEIHPYCDCDGEDPEHEELGCPINFYYQPDDFGVKWYKYVGRSMDPDEIKHEHFTEILEKCMESFGEDK